MSVLQAVFQFGKDMFLYAMTMTLIENTIFSRAIGASTSLWVIRKKYPIWRFGAVLTFVTTLSAFLARLIAPLFAKVSFFEYMVPLLFVLCISVAYIAALLLLHFIPLKDKRTYRLFIHRCTFNCAVLGALLLSKEANLDWSGYLGYGIGTGVGFSLATYFSHIAYEKLQSKKIPSSFRGFPITLLYIGILSLAVYGMIGHELPF